MGDLQVKKQPKQYDAIVIGSGAGGGMATYVLANAGLKVCLIEAGPMFDPKTDSNQLKIHGSRQDVAPVQNSVLLATLMVATGVGKLMASRTQTMVARNGNGGVPVCWVAVPITGEEFLYASGQRILNAGV